MLCRLSCNVLDAQRPRRAQDLQAEREQKRAQKKAAKAQSQQAHDDGTTAAKSRCTEPCHVILPAMLNAKQRALVHEAAEEASLQHESRGDANARRMHLGDLSLPEVTLPHNAPACTLHQLTAAIR